MVLINVLTKPASTDQAVTTPADVQADTKEEKAASQTTDVEKKRKIRNRRLQQQKNLHLLQQAR